MTPAEVKGRLKARETACKRELENMDSLAWMIGHYASFGYHDPKNYPRKSNIVAKDVQIPKDAMDDEEIKDTLTVFAQTHNAAERSKTHDLRGAENIV